ncbi:MAG: hypothetical protein HC906_19260 [Bacteroidales bacterium]|nr:hypothetical protein [Bacteroidales bacterium]
MERLSGLQVPEKNTLIFKLFEVYKQVTGSSENIDDFYFYCEMILSDFDDLDKYLVNADDMFRNLKDLKDISSYFDYLTPEQMEVIQRFWNTFSIKQSDYKDSFLSLWDSLSKIYHEYKKLLNDHNLAYQGMAYRKAAESIYDSR